jgi:hypothetical protein
MVFLEQMNERDHLFCVWENMNLRTGVITAKWVTTLLKRRTYEKIELVRIYFAIKVTATVNG